MNIDIIDLLRKRYMLSRKSIEKMWNEESDIHLSHSEWLIIDRLFDGQQTIAEVCRIVDITRQGTHKLIKKLEENGLVVTGKMKNNKRDKYVKLTEFGIACFEKNKALKIRLEDQIKNAIGTEQYSKLKQLLAADWGL